MLFLPNDDPFNKEPTSLNSAYGPDWNKKLSTTNLLQQNTPTPPPTTPPPPTATPPPTVSSSNVGEVFWISEEAWSYYSVIQKILGNPTELVKGAGGSVLWSVANKPTLFGIPNIFNKHVLRDQKIPVKCPYSKYEFFYSFISFNIPYNKIADVISLTPSITYEPLTSQLCARGNNLGYNIALLHIAIKVATNQYDIRTIHAQGPFAKFMERSKNSMVVLQYYNEMANLVKTGAGGKSTGAISFDQSVNKKPYTNTPYGHDADFFV